MRRDHLIDQPAVFRIEPLDQRAHVLVGQKLRQIVADDFAEMGQQHRHVVDGHEALALQIADEHLRQPERLHAEGRLARIVAGNGGTRPIADDHHHIADAQLAGGDDGAVDFDLIGLRVDGEIVGQLDFGDDEAILLGELPAHLAHAMRQLAMRRQQRVGELLAQAKLDLRRS